MFVATPSHTRAGVRPVSPGHSSTRSAVLRCIRNVLRPAAVLLILAAWMPAVAGDSRSPEPESRTQSDYNRQKLQANRMAELLIREEEARLRRQEEVRKSRAAARSATVRGTQAASRGGAIPEASTEPSADSGLDRIFSEGETLSGAGEQRTYPSAIVSQPTERAWQPAQPAPANQPIPTRESLSMQGSQTTGQVANSPAAEFPVSTVPMTPAQVAPQGAAGPPPGTPGLDLFHAGYSHFSQGDYSQAAESFRAFMINYPGHDLGDNAQFWIAECAYAQGDYNAAYNEYGKVVESFPFGNKVPDALLKSAYSLQELGRTEEARQLLERVISEHPGSSAARRAGERLGS